MSTKSVPKLLAKVESLKKATARARDKAGEVASELVRTAVTGGTAFTAGLVTGRYGEAKTKLFGVPGTLAVAGGAHLFALLGVGKGAEEHVRSIGNGSLSAYLTTQGLKVGAKMAAEASAPKTSGDDLMLGNDPVQALLNPSMAGGEALNLEVPDYVPAD
jgi:hypothetical protein